MAYVDDFGPAIGGVVDASDVIEAAVNNAAYTGNELRFRGGVYRVTRPINIGQAACSDYSVFNSLTTLTQSDVTPYVTTVGAGNQFDIIGESGAILVADWLPTSPEPIFALNEPTVRRRQPRISGLQFAHNDIVGPSGYPGQLAVPTYPAEAKNVFGIWSYINTLGSVENCDFWGLAGGVWGFGSYWSRLSDCRFWACGKGINVSDWNATLLERNQFHFCAYGAIVGGDTIRMQAAHFQNNQHDLRIQRSDCGYFGQMYIEDAGTDPVTTDTAVSVGEGETAFNVSNTRLENIRIASVRAGKTAISLNRFLDGEITNSRNYSAGSVTIDSLSRGVAVNSQNIPLPEDRFTELTYNRVNAYVGSDGAKKYRVYPFQASLDGTDVLPHQSVNFDIAAPVTMVGGVWAFDAMPADVTTSKFFDFRPIWLDANTVRIVATNMTCETRSFTTALNVIAQKWED